MRIGFLSLNVQTINMTNTVCLIIIHWDKVENASASNILSNMTLKDREPLMISRQLLISTLLMLGIMLSAATSALAQDTSKNNLPDEDQAGKKLQTNIMTLVNDGRPIREAVSTAIDDSLTEANNTLKSQTKAALALDIPLANQFYIEMIKSNSIFDVSKILIELNPSKAAHVITLGISLYPSFANEVFKGAALTGIIEPNDILVAALQAGADPNNISVTKALFSINITPIPKPIGAGIGAGGTGSGDTTISVN